MEGIKKSIYLLLKTRELSALVDIRNYISHKINKLDYKGLTEYDFCEVKGRFDTLKEIENLINEKIKNLTK